MPESSVEAADLPVGASGIVTVDLEALVENWRILQRQAGTCAMAAAVKADAYGLGLEPVATALAAVGCRRFFVHSFDEALALDAALAGLEGMQIAVLSGPEPEMATHSRLVPVANDLGQLALWRRVAPGRATILHLDTGLARLGMPPAESARLAEDPGLLAGLPLAAIMSHLACADERDNPLNRRQLADFTAMSAKLPAAPRSLAASFGMFLGPEYLFDLVRPGAALYGVNPTPNHPNPMRQVVGVKAKILQVREIDAGRTVGYGAAWTADRPSRVAAIGIGYADGVLRGAGNRARCFIGPQEIPVIGRISMDLITVDVSAVPPHQAQPGGFVDILGPHYGADDLARDSGTVGYELLTRLSRRLPRRYLRAKI
ncbi:MAG TPA: alanine racemase [Aliidongia sp.]|nr:alanine racemase [Aliidongia sp.]